MQIVADENIPGLDQTFARFGNIERCNGRAIPPQLLRNADVLLIRSISRIDRELLENSGLKFIGSATIGIDHVDLQAIQEAGIHFCHAPGCNADGAAQYTLAMMVLATRRAGLDLSQLRVGIVGCGNVGSRLKQLLVSAGVNEVLCCDPPLADAGRPGLVGMVEISHCNLVSFHVPLIESGPYPTHHLAHGEFFNRLAKGTLVVNSSRGQVIEPTAMLEWLSAGRGYAALDVWPHEPVIDTELLEKVIVGTPHVAGYSLDGKLNGTRMLFRQFLNWLGEKEASPLPPCPPAPELLDLPYDADPESVILAACPVERDDCELRGIANNHVKVSPPQFDQLRRNYPARRDFAGIALRGTAPPNLVNVLDSLGFHTSRN
jgi:erythronate-4-phosphate dehydrogenase